jgi:hypothetical protein
VSKASIAAMRGSRRAKRRFITQAADPKATIKDQMTIGYSNFSAEEPMGLLTLTMLYKNADVPANAVIPSSLNFEDFASIRILFSTRIDGSGNRDDQLSGSLEVLGPGGRG